MAPRGKKTPDLAEAEAVIRAAIVQSDRVVTLRDQDGRRAQRDIAKVLTEADRQLATRLAYLARMGSDATFTAAQAKAAKAQLDATLKSAQRKLSTNTKRTGGKAIEKAVARTAKTVERLERAFNGRTVSPANLAAMQASKAVRGLNAVLVTRVATSMDRYGARMGQRFSRVIATGLASGATVDQMVATLVRGGGPRGVVSLAAREVAPGVVERVREGVIPEGLFRRHRYWAERIVRTEVASAYSSSALAGLEALKAAGEPVQKKIVAVFDSRTAFDSVAVHGQVRELDQPFMDGAGRVYQHPPGRPNDRETIIAWHADWPETKSSRPRSAKRVEEARKEDLPVKDSEQLKPVAKAKPPRPPKPPPVATPTPVHDPVGDGRYAARQQLQAAHQEAIAGMRQVGDRYEGAVPASYLNAVLAQREHVAETLGIRPTRPLTRVLAISRDSPILHAAYMDWDGTMGLKVREHPPLQKTLAHEAIHTLGGAGKHAYSGNAAKIEEAVTEQLAQDYMGARAARRTGGALAPIATPVDRKAALEALEGGRLPQVAVANVAQIYGSYRRDIKAVIAVGKQVDDPQRLQDLFSAAAKRWKQRSYSSRDEAINAFVHALEPQTPAELAWYKLALKDRAWRDNPY